MGGNGDRPVIEPIVGDGETHFLKSATLEANGVLHLRYGSFGVEPGSMVDAPITRIGKNEIWFEESGETGRIVRSLFA